MSAFTLIQTDLDPFVIGVISDTLYPDRVDELHPHLKEELLDHKVNLIFHGEIFKHCLSSQTSAPLLQ
jgi:hypothetical protein